MTLHEVAELSKNILDEHKRKGNVPQDWKFKFNVGRRLLGKCDYVKKTISLSKHFALVATKEQIIEITLHEISHCAIGRGHGHSEIWKKKAIELGAKPVRCASYESCKNIPAKFTGKCPTCFRTFQAFRRLKNMDKRICSKQACKAAGRYVVWEAYKNVIL